MKTKHLSVFLAIAAILLLSGILLIGLVLFLGPPDFPTRRIDQTMTAIIGTNNAVDKTLTSLVPTSQDVDPRTVQGLFNPDGFASPQSVTIVGTVQSKLGYSDDWQAECDKLSLTYIAEYDLWRGSFNLPAGNYEYKAILNGTWEQNYGLRAESGGQNIPLNLEKDRLVTFYYDHNTGWITDSVNSIIAALKGFTTNLCFKLDDIGEFAAPCMQTWLQDIDGDGIYIFQTPHLPAGDYAVTVVVDHGPNSELGYYGQNGEPGGVYIPFMVPADRTLITFAWDSTSKSLTIETGGHVPLTDSEIVITYCVFAENSCK